ncbi:MAG TPA: peptide chain release factor N(5)-glutamine methyltransferase [Pyrinomonadaceae bacterium]|nr:peptide chain release factor N(5)-glutamine methyltransferase [Pyrinomonadaceae bacterium]
MSQIKLLMTIAEALLQGTNKLRKADVAEARREAGSLLGCVLGRDRTFIISHAEDEITSDQAEMFARLIEDRAKGKPLQYITGHQEFFNLDFEVTPAVLIPRPETELMVETALRLLPHVEAETLICDVGTGSGCVAITLLHERQNARGLAIDISPAAIEIAKRNAAKHNVSDRLEFLISDCFAEVKQEERLFDLIVSNPPYIPASDLEGLQREVRDYEPHLALEAGADGLSIIRRLLADVGVYLKPGGYFLFEIGFDQSDAVEKLIAPILSAGSWKLLDIYSDLQGIPRTVALQKLM